MAYAMTQQDGDVIAQPSGYQMPLYREDDKVLLMVILTDLSVEIQAFLVRYFQNTMRWDTKIETWKPSQGFLHSVAKQSAHRDSVNNLYALAACAYRAGLKWRNGETTFVVADELTKRQVSGLIWLGENDIISLMVLTVQAGLQRAEVLGKDLWVIAQRFQLSPIYNEHQIARSREAEIPIQYQKFEDTLNNFPLIRLEGWHHLGQLSHWVYTPFNSIFKKNMDIYDPDRAIFTDNAPFVLGWEEFTRATAAELSKKLPPELALNVITYLHHESTYSASWPIWQHQQSDRHLLVFVLFPATSEELLSLQANAQGTLDDFVKAHCAGKGRGRRHEKRTIELIPLDRHRIFSRRNLMEFWDQYSYHGFDERTAQPYLHVLLGPSPILDDNLATVEVQRTGWWVMKMFQNNFLNMIATTLRLRARDSYVPYVPNPWQLTLHHPDKPFYDYPPRWDIYTQGIKASSPGLYIPVFYLTSQLTTEQDELIRMHIHAPQDTPEQEVHKAVCYVPWDRVQDAKLQDVWDILWEMFRYDGRDYAFPVFCCIDEQSSIDQTVMIVCPDWYMVPFDKIEKEIMPDMPKPQVRGIRYTRIGASKAHDATEGLRHGDKESLQGSKWKSYSRPGWPDPGTLPNERKIWDQLDEEDRMYLIGHFLPPQPRLDPNLPPPARMRPFLSNHPGLGSQNRHYRTRGLQLNLELAWSVFH